MMKSYVCDNQFRLVGKAWEVKHHLRAIVEQTGGTLKLSEYLNGLKVTAPPQAPRLHLVK